MGESSLDDTIVSPAGAIGVWQIMPFNAAPWGLTVQDLYNPVFNAHVAVMMSGGGTNCAAWDSCYADINASGRYRFLSWPEVASQDYGNLPRAQAALLGHGLKGMTAPAEPGVAATLAASVATMQRISDRQLPAIAASVAASSRAMSTFYRGRWRP